MKPLPLSYFQNEDILALSRDLLGKVLITSFGQRITGGIIIETEAYKGPEDKASHAYGGRKTKRNEVMYQEGGVCYVYTCYGIHSLFNIVTHRAGTPHAILVRAIAPTTGVDTILERRGKKVMDKTVSGGPGTLTKALGIRTSHSGRLLDRAPIWIEDRGIVVNEITTAPRIGIDYAEEDAKLPWRFIAQSYKNDTKQLPEK